MRKTFLLLFILLLLTTTLAGCGSTNSEEETLVVAMELAYPPFETKDDDGNPSGISVDLAYALGEYLGMDVEIENTAWDGLIPSLQTGKADIIISSMTITEERSETILFSDPYANSMLGILLNIESDVTEASDLNSPDMTIAVKTGSTGEIYARANLADATIIALSDESACVTEVSQGKADAFLYDQLTIYRNQQANPETTKAIFIPFQDAEQWGIGIALDNEELKTEIDAFLEEFTASGGFDDLTDKYLSEEKAAFDELGFTWFFDLV